MPVPHDNDYRVHCSTRSSFSAATLLLIGGLAAMIPSTTHAADLSEPRAAAAAYLKALHAGDLSGAEAAAIVDDVRRTLLSGQVEYLGTERTFREAILKAFPDAAKELPDPAAQIDAFLAKTPVQKNGDRVTLTPGGGLATLDLRQVNQQWKVDLPTMFPDDVVSEVTHFRTAIAAAMKSLTPEIAAGKFAAMAEVKRELETRVKVQLAMPPENPTTEPAM
jgi:hypothetical protein